MSTPEQRAAKVKYNRSPKGRASARKYNASPKGRAAKAKSQASLGARISAAKYQASPKGRANTVKYCQTPKGKANGVKFAAIRRARKLAATVEPFTQTDLAKHVAALGGRCVYCDGPYEHLDHVYPLSLGGSHDLDNLVPSCASCNMHKSDTLPLKFLLATVAAMVLP